MIDLGVALTWAAISVASVKGLSVLARVAATNDAEGEPVALTSDVSALTGLRSIGAAPRQPGEPMSGLAASTQASLRARARL